MTAIEPVVRIGLLHALEESIQPARLAFQSLWPEAYCFDLLDTALASDLAHCGQLDERMTERFRILAAYAQYGRGVGGQTAGLLFTCSAFGPAIDRVKSRLAIPVLRPNEAAFDEALELGSRLALIVSFLPSLASLETELRAMAARRGQSVQITTVFVDGALDALKRGMPDTHDRLVAEAAKKLDHVDAIVLGQFSMMRARSAVAQVCNAPVLTTPHSAVVALRARICVRE
jgi:Asp/Glu/hydantoin racemase